MDKNSEMFNYLSTLLQFDKICRTCLSVKSEMKPLFRDGLEKKLNSVTGIEAAEDDGFPNRMCLQCVDQCDRAFTFQHACKKSNATLHLYLSPEFQAQLMASVDNVHETLLPEQLQLLENILSHPKDVHECIVHDHNYSIASIENDSLEIEKNINIAKRILLQSDQIKGVDFEELKLQQKDHLKMFNKQNGSKIVEGETPLIKTEHEEFDITDIIEIKEEIDEGTGSADDTYPITSTIATEDEINELLLYEEEVNMEERDTQTKQMDILKAFDKELVIRLTRFDSFKVAKAAKRIEENKIQIIDNTREPQEVEEEIVNIYPNMDSNVTENDTDETVSCNRKDDLEILDSHTKMKHMKSIKKTVDDIEEEDVEVDIMTVEECDEEEVVEIEEVADGIKKPETETIDIVEWEEKEAASAMSDMKEESTPKRNDKSLSCPICGICFKWAINLCKHIKLHSKRKKYLTCEYCEETFIDANKLQVHQQRHKKEEKPYKCDVCSKSFSRNEVLNNHLLFHKGEKPHKCNICKETFLLSSTLKRHLSIHFGENVYECNICQQIFSSITHLDTHLQVHGGIFNHKCNLCNKTFAEKASFERHIAFHSENPYKCNFCTKCFSKREYLHNHLVNHSKTKPYGCNMCCKSFSNKYDLENHLGVHSEKKPYECNLCQKTFSNKKNLSGHQKIHSIERPHKCEICHRSFKSKEGLKSHLRIHTGEMPHECNICQRKFATLKSLRRHHLLHTERKPYKCSICDEVFLLMSDLEGHIQTHFKRKSLESRMSGNTSTEDTATSNVDNNFDDYHVVKFCYASDHDLSNEETIETIEENLQLQNKTS